MEYIYPDYYKEFECIAGECKDTCCAQWIIVPDDKSLRKYKNFKGEFAPRIQNSIDYKNKEIKRYNGACVFLNEDKLCDLYSEAGADMLCKTCRRYPRHYEEFENLREVTLSVSCPEVARILLNKKDEIKFKSRIQDNKDEEYDDFDYLLFTKLQETRELYYKLLWNRKLSFEKRIALILTMSHDFDNHELFEWDDLILKFNNENFILEADDKFNAFSRKKSIKSNDDIKKIIFAFILELYDMEHLVKKWQGELDKALMVIDSIDDISDAFNRFDKYMQDRRYEYEQLIIYFISTYYLGSVYDGRAYDMLRFSIVNVLMIYILGFTKWIQKDESFEKEEQINLVYRYSREVEHSDINLKGFEENIGKKSIYKLDNLLFLLMKIINF